MTKISIDLFNSMNLQAKLDLLNTYILKDKFDPNKSEFLNMSSNGYYQLFDCGNLIYILT